MKGDFTRFTFDPAKRYTQVLKQQGRVDLDADWNESGDIFDYLDRTTRIDVIGECGVPVHAPGFEIAFLAPNDLDVSAGRMYVHGILCELFQPTTYLTQPDLPNSPALAPVNGRRDLVYIDVWQRLITAIEDPEIREVALGGPDTCARLKTVFQVRIQQDIGDADCPNAPLPEPGGGLMTCSTVPVPPSDDPCLISPTGGYRGLENRLYRVEIHNPGNLGVATFKWSRDNGSVAFSISEFPASQPNRVRVKKLGLDQVLALRRGDWVEVSGDQTDLNAYHTGAPGTLARIDDIDEANLELILSADVSAHSSETNPKVRRWDQNSAAIPVTAGPIVLEDGIQVQFSGSDFRTGDYWTFAARTNTGAIEEFSDAPPHGVTHHYCPLAIVEWTVAGGNITAEITDCRDKFPPLTEIPEGGCCCCTVTVAPGGRGDFTSITAAMASLSNQQNQAFVRLCILQGEYHLSETVVVGRGQIVISGCGRQTQVFGPENGPAFLVQLQTEVGFEDFSVVMNSSAAAIAARTVSGLRIDGMFIETQGDWGVTARGAAIAMRGNDIRGGVWIQDGSSGIELAKNVLHDGSSAGVALGGLAPGDEFNDSAGVQDIGICRNRIERMRGNGVSTALGGPEDDAFGEIENIRLTHNTIQGCVAAPPEIPFHTEAAAGILLQNAIGVHVRGNHVADNGAGQKIAACGIFLDGCTAAEITGNHLENNGVPGGAANCIAFRAMTPDTVPVPRVHGGIQFTHFDFSGQPTRVSRVQSMGGQTGLNAERRTVITLPAAADRVSLDLRHFSTPGVVTAFNQSGAQVGSHTMTANAEHVELSASGIVRVEVSAPQNELLIQEFCVGGQNPPFYQGGIVVRGIDGPTLESPPVPGVPKGLFRRGDPALAVRGNTVITPSGQALLVSGIGPFAITGNSFTTLGVWLQPHGLPGLALAVLIFDFGWSPVLPLLVGFNSMATTDTNLALFNASVPPEIVDGRVEFNDNQVTFRPVSGSPGELFNSCLIATFDDASVADNQFLTETIPQGSLVAAQLLAIAASVRVTGNRIAETPLRALFSCWAQGGDVMVSLNQTMHCIFTSGVRVFDPAHATNQVVVSLLCQRLSALLSNS